MQSKRVLLDRLNKVIPNRYQAVLIAAKRARQINAERLAKMQMMAEDEEIDIDYRKVTSIALEDVLEARVKLKEKKK
jgi:DNA-directed RNA polymerase omega subunit